MWQDYKYVSHTDKEIKGFYGPFRFLSNFYVCDIEFEGLYYASTENAYQAAKTLNLDLRKQFQFVKPNEARNMGRVIELRADWDAVKLKIMQTLTFYKYLHNEDLRQRLLATNPKYLEETNHWNDRYWGVVDGVGENNLGKSLMQTRNYFSCQI